AWASSATDTPPARAFSSQRHSRSRQWSLRLVFSVALFSLTVATASSSVLGVPQLKVVAKDLANPRKIFVGSGGAIYVVEAGTGGSDKCSGTGPGATCVGLTGAITRIVGGHQRRVVTGLVSWATPVEQRAQGAAAVVVRGGEHYVLVGDAVVNARGGNVLGSDGAAAGRLIATPSGKARPRSIANLVAFEASHNPDRGAGPGARFGSPSVDSNPY